MLLVSTNMVANQKRFIFWVSFYIISFVAFYLWTATVDKIGMMGNLRYWVTGIFALSFLFLSSSISIIKPTIPMLIFISYCCLILLLHGEFTHATLYVLWMLYAIVLLPKIISLNFDVFENYITNMFYGTLALLLILFIYAEYFDLNVYFGGEHRLRFTSGLSNPAIYSALVVTSLWMSLLLFVLKGKKIHLLLIPFFFYLLIIADLRTDLYGTLLGLVAFLILKSRYSSLYLLIAAFFIILALLWLFTNYSLHGIDVVTSGRLYKWSHLYDISGFADNIKVMFFGMGKFVGHYDNQWLKTLVMFGLIGFVIHVFAVLYLFLKLYLAKKKVDDLVVRNVFAWGGAALIMISAMGFTMYVFPSLGNVYNLILLPVVFATSSFCINGSEVRKKI
jgi:hypothetical protein